jgi:phospholipase C
MRRFLLLLLFLSGCAGSGQSYAPQAQALPRTVLRTGYPHQHVIIIIQENRSVDNLFNGLRGADTQSYGYDSAGNTIALQPVPLNNDYDLGHSHASYVSDYNGGQMNGFTTETVKTPPSPSPSPSPVPTDPAYAYVPQSSQTQPYWTLAEQYAFADHMFATNQGPSFPAHLYLISGTGWDGLSDGLYVDSNPDNVYYVPGMGGCDSPAGTTITLIDIATGVENGSMFPCFDHATLADSLDNAGLAWRYYQMGTGAGIWKAFDAIQHIRDNAALYANVVTPQTNILSDISNGNLADVSWVTPNDLSSDHPEINDGSGPSWVASIVNAVGASSYWKDTTIFVVWDDWGGWYDHVAPPQYNGYELGFRVPLIAISPYAKAGYVSHTTHEFGSILKFVEKLYGLPSLGYTDARADDLSDMFNYSQKPRSFSKILAAPLTQAERTSKGAPDDE